MYIIKHSERNPDLFTVGTQVSPEYWEPWEDFTDKEEAEMKCHFMNGGNQLTKKQQQANLYFDALVDIHTMCRGSIDKGLEFNPDEVLRQIPDILVK